MWSNLNYRTNNLHHTRTCTSFTTWFQSHKHPREQGLYTNKLTIPKVTTRDAGKYICLGTNRLGYHVKDAYLTVIDGTYRLRIDNDTECRANHSYLVRHIIDNYNESEQEYLGACSLLYCRHGTGD